MRRQASSAALLGTMLPGTAAGMAAVAVAGRCTVTTRTFSAVDPSLPNQWLEAKRALGRGRSPESPVPGAALFLGPIITQLIVLPC